jgi:hypothetical protein
MPLIPKVELIGDGQAEQHGGVGHELVAFCSMYMPAGQCTVRLDVEAGDSRPSGNTARTFQTEKGGPSWPLDNAKQRSVMRVLEMRKNWAGCEKEVKPTVAGRNTHEALVTLAAVNSGKKNTVEGEDGTQLRLKLLPVNGKSSGEKACTVGKTSTTETATSTMVI